MNPGRYYIIVSSKKDPAVGDSPLLQFAAWVKRYGARVELNEWDPSLPTERFIIFEVDAWTRQWPASSGIPEPVAIDDTVRKRADLSPRDVVEQAARQVYEAKESAKEGVKAIASAGWSGAVVLLALLWMMKGK